MTDEKHETARCPNCAAKRTVSWEIGSDYAWARMSSSCWCNSEVTAYGRDDVVELLDQLRVDLSEPI